MISVTKETKSIYWIGLSEDKAIMLRDSINVIANIPSIQENNDVECSVLMDVFKKLTKELSDG